MSFICCNCVYRYSWSCCIIEKRHKNKRIKVYKDLEESWKWPSRAGQSLVRNLTIVGWTSCLSLPLPPSSSSTTTSPPPPPPLLLHHHLISSLTHTAPPYHEACRWWPATPGEACHTSVPATLHTLPPYSFILTPFLSPPPGPPPLLQCRQNLSTVQLAANGLLLQVRSNVFQCCTTTPPPHPLPLLSLLFPTLNFLLSITSV